MHRRPDRKLATLATTLAVLPLLGGCVQATRHSNTMYFGTNTTFGIKAGASTGEVPEVIVGYDRQEAVILPLLANTVDKSTPPNNRLGPCPVDKPIEVSGGEYAVHPCSFVSIKGGNLDSYSVLASFGAEFSARAQNPEASGGLAQYFSTGMAAQILADRGGAALVSTNKSASEGASRSAGTANLFPGTTPFAVGSGKAFDDKMLELRKAVRDTATDQVRGKKMQGLLDAVKPALPSSIASSILQSCKSSADACITAINSREALLLSTDNFEAAVAGWDAY